MSALNFSKPIWGGSETGHGNGCWDETYSGRPFKPKAPDNLLYEKSWFSFTNSEAHHEGAGVGGDITVGKGVVLLLRWTLPSRGLLCHRTNAGLLSVPASQVNHFYL